MTALAGSYARPLQGMSQQPMDTRQEGQCSWQLNAQNDVVKGLIKRPGTVLDAVLPKAVPEGSKIHYYNRGDEERYWIIVHADGSLDIYDEQGKPQVVKIDVESQKYLISTVPADFISSQTIGDFTFLMNSLVSPKWGAESEPLTSNTALVPVLFADYGKKYSIILNGAEVAAYTTPDGSHPSHINNVDTSFVANQLLAGMTGMTTTSREEYGFRRGLSYRVGAPGHESHTKIYYQYWVTLTSPAELVRSITWNNKNYQIIRMDGNNALFYDVSANAIGSPSGYIDQPMNTLAGKNPVVTYQVPAASGLSAYRIGNTLIIQSDGGVAFSIATTDGRDGKDMPGIFHAVEDVSKLPKYAPVGYFVQVTGRGKAREAMYWLRAERANPGTEQIVWMEAREPGSQYHIDQYSMPQSLVREKIESGVAHFKLQPTQWADRGVGNNINNPPPSFIQDNQALNAVGILQNRMFFLAGESFVASQSNEFLNFFKVTTQTDRGDNPIDVYADTEDVNILRNYAVLDGDLLIVSDNTQFIIKGDKVLTKDNISMKPVTQYKNNSRVKPVSTGETIMFSYNSGKFVQVREFFTDSYSDTKKARPVTEHVDQLIEGSVVQITGSTNVNTVMLRTKENPERMYAYDYLWQGADKVQSAWWVYSLPDGDKILHCEFDRNYMLLLTHRKGIGNCIESVDMGDPVTEGLSFPLRLDLQFQIKAVRKGKYSWELVLPAGLSVSEDTPIIRSTGCWPADIGNTAKFILQEGKYQNEQLDLAPEGTDEAELWVGTKYMFEYTPTMPVLKDERGLSLSLDRLTVDRMFLNYEDTGAFNVRVKNKWGAIREYGFGGRTMGEVGNIVGFAQPASGQLPVPVRDNTRNSELTIYSDSYLPFSLRNIEWRGQMTTRGRRV